MALLIAQILEYVRLLAPYWRRASAPSVHLFILRRALTRSDRSQLHHTTADGEVHKVTAHAVACRFERASVGEKLRRVLDSLFPPLLGATGKALVMGHEAAV